MCISSKGQQAAYLAIVRGSLLAAVAKATMYCVECVHMQFRATGALPGHHCGGACVSARLLTLSLEEGVYITRVMMYGKHENLRTCTCISSPQVVPAKGGLLMELAEETAGKEEPQLRRLINESEEIAEQRNTIRSRLTLLQRASREIAAFM